MWHPACSSRRYERIWQEITHETHLSEKPHPFWLAHGARDRDGRVARRTRLRADGTAAHGQSDAECRSGASAERCRSGQGAPDRGAQRVERSHAVASRRPADRRLTRPRATVDHQFQRADWQERRLARLLCEGRGQSLHAARERNATGACDRHAQCRGDERRGVGSRPRDPRETRRVPHAPGHVQGGG